TELHSFARWFIPGLGVSELEKAIVNLSATVEIIMNASADAIRAQQIEIKSISQLAIQNRLTLDLLYAKERGVCTVINTSCCSYIDLDKQIETDLE
ncbi:ERVV2 protein, partial [Spelaeornis formosus]|nr:ERVV2 protein [Elachura formosa]